MNAKPRDSKTHARTVREHDAATRAPDDPREVVRRHRKGRIGAAQLAAPSTRRWRRARRTES